MKVFITKYALTNGIHEIDDAKHCTNISVNMIAHKNSAGHTQCFHKPDWHETLHEAFTRAEAMRVSRLVSLRKSVAKLEKLTFVVQS